MPNEKSSIPAFSNTRKKRSSYKFLDVEHLYNIPLLSVFPYEVPLVLSFKHLQHGQHFWTAFCTVNSLTPKISHRIVNGCDVKETIPWFAEIVIKDNPVNDKCTWKIFFSYYIYYQL